MEDRIKGIVIRTVDVGETDRLLTLLTAESGKITAKAKGCRQAKSKLRYATQPMCLGDYIFTQSKGGRIVTACDTVENFESVALSLDRYYVSGVVLEGANFFGRENVADPALFLLTLSTLKKVTYDPSPLSSGAVYLLDLLRISGHEVRTVCSCGEEGEWLDLESSAVCCDKHKTGLVMPVSKRWGEAVEDIRQDYAAVGTATLRELYVTLARCLWHTAGCKLSSVQELCKMWDVLAE